MRSIHLVAALASVGLVVPLGCSHEKPVVTSPTTQPTYPQQQGPYAPPQAPYGYPQPSAPSPQQGPYGTAPRPQPPYGSGREGPRTEPAAVRDYVQWLGRRPDSWTKEEAYVSQGLKNLAEALSAVNAASTSPDAEIERRISDVRTAALRLTLPETAEPGTNHARVARDALRTATDVLDDLAASRGNDASTLREIDRLRAAVQRIDPARPLTSQRNAVQDAFESAADPLESLGR